MFLPVGQVSRRLRMATPLAVFGAYVATAVAGFALEPSELNRLPVYLAPGVGLVVLLRFRTQLWPTIVLAALAVGLLRGTRIDLTLLGACLIALQAILACHALRSQDFRPDLSRLRDGLLFIGVTFATMGLIAGVFAIAIGLAHPEAQPITAAFRICIGCAVGTLISAPPILMWTSKDAATHEARERPIETALLFLLLLVACDAAFGGRLGSGRAHYPLAFLPFPFLLWIGFRLGPLALVTGTSMASIGAILGTTHGLGPFAAQSPAAALALDWVFLGMMQITFLLLAAVVAERTAAEEALRAEKERAEKATRAKSEFLSVMNHELRTPLNSILLAIDLMLESELSHEQRDLGKTVVRAGEALRVLVNDTLDMARIEEGRMELLSADFAPADLSRGVIDVFADAANRKEIALTEHVDGELPSTLRGDVVRLRQVLINLVGNSMKFTDHGRIELHTECRSQEHGIVRVQWRVTDSGPGISAEDCRAIFQPFTQADSGPARSHGGTGLGLAISRRLVELMGGEIGARSEPGTGSTFWLSVPLYTVPPQEIASPAEAKPPRENVA